MSRTWKRLASISISAFCVMLIVGLTAYFYGLPESSLAGTEQYKVFSDYVAAGLTGESHSLGDPSGLVVILNHTTVSSLFLVKDRLTEYRALIAMLPYAKRNLELNSQWPILDLIVRNLRSENLKERLSLQVRYVLASDEEVIGGVQLRFPQGYGYLTFTRVGFNRNLTEAVFYTEHICGLCGEGKYVHMRKLNGRWTIVAESGTWIS